MTCKGTLFSSNRALCVEKKCEEFSELAAKVHTTTLRSLGLVRHPPKASGFFATPWHYTIRKLKGKQKNSANYTQTLHFALYPLDYPRVTKCIVYIPNYTQTIHEAYIERQKDEETKRQRVGEIKRLKVGEIKRLKD